MSTSVNSGLLKHLFHQNCLSPDQLIVYLCGCIGRNAKLRILVGQIGQGTFEGNGAER